MLLKHIITDEKILVKYESRRPTIFAAGGFPNPGTANGPRIDPGSIGQFVWAAPDVHRFRRARRKERRDPEPSIDRPNIACSAVSLAG